MTLLTKADILEGIENIQLKQIKALNNKELWLRPLSSAELDEINYIELEGIGTLEQSAKSRDANVANAAITQSNKFNVLNVTKASDNAEYILIEKSLDNKKYQEDPWKLDDIKKFPKPAIKELVKIVNNISGVEVTTQDIKKFPED